MPVTSCTVCGADIPIGESRCPRHRPVSPSSRAKRGRSRFRDEVLRRAGYRCQHPGDDHGGPLAAHHLKLVSEGGTNDPANGVALCARHHQDLHRT